MYKLVIVRGDKYVGNSILWWAESSGYTTDIDKTDVFTGEQAAAIRKNRGTDRPWPKDYIDGKSSLHVDMQDCNYNERMTMNVFEKYRRTNTSEVFEYIVEMREYIPGEDLSEILVCSVNNPIVDLGMIARSLFSPYEKYYVGREYFEENFEKV